MRAQSKERQLAEAFVTLADTMVDEYDVVDLLQTVVELCSSLLDATDAGILLPNSAGELEVAASSSERSRLIGLLQLGEGEGPCVDAYRTGLLVTVDNIASTYARWPSFAIAAAESGYASMHAIPLRLRKETIGSLNLFRDRTGGFSADDAVTARALADGATIGILHERSLREADLARSQLQHALGQQSHHRAGQRRDSSHPERGHGHRVPAHPGPGPELAYPPLRSGPPDRRASFRCPGRDEVFRP